MKTFTAVTTTQGLYHLSSLHLEKKTRLPAGGTTGESFENRLGEFEAMRETASGSETEACSGIV
jgi:hypothetical protein